MNKKIPIAGFFVTIILIAQFTVLAKPVKANEHEKVIIDLKPTEFIDLKDAVNSIGDDAIKNSLNSVIDNYLVEERQIEVELLPEILDVLNNALENQAPLSSNIVINIQDLAQLIIDILKSHIADIPQYILEEIIGDLEVLINLVVHFACGNYIDVAVNLYSLLINFEEIIEYLKDFPTTDGEFKPWIKQRIKNAIKRALWEALIEIKDVYVDYYIKPHLGYVGRIGTDLYDLTTHSVELIKDYPIMLERYKTIFINLPESFNAFKEAEKRIDKIYKMLDFISKLKEALSAATSWYLDIVDKDGPDVAVDIAVIVSSISDLIRYCNETPEPWYQDITITGHILGVDSAEIAFKDDNLQTEVVTATKDKKFTIHYVTSITENPLSAKSFTLEAKSDGEIKDYKCLLAYSDGDVSVKFDFNENNKENPSIGKGFFKERLMHILESISLFFKNIFNF